MNVSNPLTPVAERALISISASISLPGVSEDLDAWIDCLRRVLPDCEDCVVPLEPVRLACIDLVEAQTAQDRRGALSILEAEVRKYYRLAAAKKFEEWQKLDKERVVD